MCMSVYDVPLYVRVCPCMSVRCPFVCPTTSVRCPYDVRTMSVRCPYDVPSYVRGMSLCMSVVCPYDVRMCVADEEHDEGREEEDFRQGRGQGA